MTRWLSNHKQLVVGLVALTIIIGIAIYWIHRTGLLWAIPHYLQHVGAWGILISFGLIVVQSVVPYAPFALLAGFNTSAHGFWLGYFVSFAGVVTGNLMLYLLAKQIVKIVFHGKIETLLMRHPKLQVVRNKVVRARFGTAFSILFVLRIQPWVPSSWFDVLSGAAGVKFKPFIFSTLAGQVPSVAIMAYLGHRLLNFQQYKQEIILIVGIAIVIGIVYLLRNRRMRV